MQKCGKNESRGASERYNYTMAGFAQHKVINKNYGFGEKCLKQGMIKKEYQKRYKTQFLPR